MLQISTAPDQIRNMPAGAFWTREVGLSQEEMTQRLLALRDMPVHNTSYLIDEEISPCLLAVPYRHRN